MLELNSCVLGALCKLYSESCGGVGLHGLYMSVVFVSVAAREQCRQILLCIVGLQPVLLALAVTAPQSKRVCWNTADDGGQVSRLQQLQDLMSVTYTVQVNPSLALSACTCAFALRPHEARREQDLQEAQPECTA
jgi:hypothetical protein